MLVEIVSAIGSLTTTALGILAYKNKGEKSEVIRIDKKLSEIKGVWLLEHPFENSIQWLDALQKYLITLGKPLNADEYLTYKSVIMVTNWLKDNPPYASPKWLYDYRDFVVNNKLKSVIIGVHQTELFNMLKTFVGVVVSIIIPLVAPAVLAVIVKKYQEKTLTAKDLEAISPCPTGQTRDSTGKCVYSFGQ